METGAARTIGSLADRLRARGELVGVEVTAPDWAPIPIADVTIDSRRVAPGDCFVAIPGAHADGHHHAAAAVAAGAVACIVERPIDDVAVPQLVVAGSRRCAAYAASWVHGDPSSRIGVIGITGTDGKTTTAWLVRSMLEACGLPTGLVGTIDVIVGGRSLGNPGRATTPEAPDLQRHLAAMVAAGDRWAVVETTSHGLAQDRVLDVAYDIGVFTNLTSEHLELHGTVEAYRAAKQRLFEHLAPIAGFAPKPWGRHAVLNADDPSSVPYADAARRAGAGILRYGERGRLDVTARDVREDRAGIEFLASTLRWHAPVRLQLAGRFNVHNAMAAIGVGEALGLDPVRIRDGLAGVAAVPGRMQRIDAGQPFTVIIDYAHTAESLATVLDELAPVAARAGGGVIAVFGSAGDRDPTKRAPMGRVAGERCRAVVLTDEDPRSEPSDAILEEIAAGAADAGRSRAGEIVIEPDRAAAIAAAFALARPGDIVLLAGKGHERSIERRGVREPWDEAGAAREALAGRGWRAAP